MSASGSKIGFVAAAVLLVLLALTFALRLPCCRQEPSPRSAAPAVQPATDEPKVAGPSAAAVRSALDRAIPWLEQTRIRPAQEGFGLFRFYAPEVHSWFVLYAFADDAARKERYRTETVERLRLLGDGRPLVDFLQGARMPDFIADVLMVALMARTLEVPLPVLERALPSLYQRGLDDPRRPVALQIPLAWLAGSLGLPVQPSLDQLRAQGMLRTHPREITMKAPDVYYLTHEIFGLTEYGLRQGDFNPQERAYLDRSLPFWSLLHAILNQADLEAEMAICHQAAGTTHTHGYGEAMLFLLSTQTADGAFGESLVQSNVPREIRLGRLHTMMVALHALLGHEALLLKGTLPGWPGQEGRAGRRN